MKLHAHPAMFLSAGALGLAGADQANDPPIERLEPEVQGEVAGDAGRLAPDSTAQRIQESILDGALDRHLAAHSEGLKVGARRAYALRVFDPIWTRDGARGLMDELERADHVGLSVDPALREAVHEAIADLRTGDRPRAAEADILITSAFLAYADARTNGATEPDNVGDLLHGRTNPERIGLWLAEAGADRLDYDALDPDHAAYRELERLRELYADYAETGAWQRIDPPATLIEAGDRHELVPRLRERLAAEGYAIPEPPTRPAADQTGQAASNGEGETVQGDEAPGDENRNSAGERLFSEALSEVLAEFQADRGLKEDGIVGPRTLEALNTPPEDLVARIDANLERWRWAPERFPDRHVRVNIPAYRVYAFENGEAVVDMKAIVGQASRETPIVWDSIEYLVANPRWYVPESILERDKLEHIRENPADYIQSHDYYVLDRDTGSRVPAAEIDWEDADVEEQYRLVQESGEDNALGELKFIFPNQHSVYLHGTPAEHLFGENLRSFSSGCMRIERPLEMSDWIASNDAGLTPERVRDAVEGEELQRLDLAEPVPVYTTYFTVETDDDGSAVFHPDIYGWDRETIERLEAEPVRLAES